MSRKNIGWSAALVAAGAIAGGVLASTLTAWADPTPAPSASSSDGSSTMTAPDPNGRGRHGGCGGQHSDETPLTGTDAEKAKAAALKALPGATIERVETDAGGAVYEAHVTKSDGSRATVLFDKDFNVTSIETRMGKHRGQAAPPASPAPPA